VTAPAACATCNTELAPGLLACPGCHALVHSDRLKAFATEAEEAERQGEHSLAMSRWREALQLLPSNSTQYHHVAAKVEALAALPAAPAATPHAHRSWLGRSAAGIVGLVVLLLTKGKFLLAGLLKLPTLLSMLAAFGVYWTMWGWRFALGLVGTIYVHEMGHVAMLVRYGIKASPPMFVPGLGAYVRLHQHLPSRAQDARVGLAGPVWGLGAGVACLAIGRLTGSASWLAIAKVTALLNLFNLIPVWQLDGARAFSALSTVERWVVVLIVVAAWLVTRQGLLVLLALVCAWQAWRRNDQHRDAGALGWYGFLVLALAWLMTVDVPVGM